MDGDSCQSNKQINRAKFKRTQVKKVHHKDQKQLRKGQNSNKSVEVKRKNISHSESHEEFSNKLLSQLDCRFADLSDEDDTDNGKAFEELLNAPVSTSSFVFKCEKKWTWDSSQFSDYFSVDVNQLSRIFNCIPFTQYVQVDEKYLNKDELSSINSSSERVKKEYMEELEHSLMLEQSNVLVDKNSKAEIQNSSNECNNTIDAMEEDLDFLLSLKEPVRVLSTNISSGSSRFNEDSKTKTSVKPTKSIDLEKWLDSVLDD